MPAARLRVHLHPHHLLDVDDALDDLPDPCAESGCSSCRVALDHDAAGRGYRGSAARRIFSIALPFASSSISLSR